MIWQYDFLSKLPNHLHARSLPNVPINLKTQNHLSLFSVPILSPTHANFASVPMLDLPGQVLVAEEAAEWTLYTSNTETAFSNSFSNPSVFLILL